MGLYYFKSRCFSSSYQSLKKSSWIKIILNFVPIFFLISLNSCVKLPELNNPIDPSNYGSFIGKIIDEQSGASIQGVIVETNPISSRSISDNQGNFRISNLSPGFYYVFASKKGYSYDYRSQSAYTGEAIAVDLRMRSNYCPGMATIFDERNNKTYSTVLIGNQCWLRENLDVGTRINGSQNQTNNSIIEKYCYNDDPANCTSFGGLYQWEEAMQYIMAEGTKGICPIGWHIPTFNDYLILTIYNDGSSLKEIGQVSGMGAGSNTSGFSALLVGMRNSSNGSYNGLGGSTFILSSTESPLFYPKLLYLDDDSSSVSLIGYSRDNGFSVRCLKD